MGNGRALDEPAKRARRQRYWQSTLMGRGRGSILGGGGFRGGLESAWCVEAKGVISTLLAIDGGRGKKRGARGVGGMMAGAVMGMTSCAALHAD